MNDPWVARILYQGAICLVDLDLLVKTKICLRSPVGQDSYPFERLFVKGGGEKTHQLEYVFMDVLHPTYRIGSSAMWTGKSQVRTSHKGLWRPMKMFHLVCSRGPYPPEKFSRMTSSKGNSFIFANLRIQVIQGGSYPHFKQWHVRPQKAHMMDFS